MLDNHRLRCSVVVPAAGTLAVLAGWLLASCAPPSTGSPDSLLPAGPFAPEPSEEWVTPSGRRIARGTVDELGYVLPLDVHRRPLPAIPVERPQRREPGWWHETAPSPAAAGSAPTAIVLEHRLGLDNGHSQNETAIDVAGSTLIASWNEYTDSGLMLGFARSTDRGQTWSSGFLGGHDVMSDPAVKAGGGGRWYVAYLATGGAGGADGEIYVRRSVNDGGAWPQPVAVTADDSFDDKPGLDARGDEVLVAWADFGFSPARVRAARSLDGGQSFGNDTVLVDASGGGNGACPVIAADGAYYVFWRDSAQELFWLSRSLDQGTSWSPDAPIAGMSPLPATLPGDFRIVNLPSAADDPVTGDLVVVWNDQLFGDPDVLSIRSADRGETWSPPVRVNDDFGTDAQFFPRVAIDESGIVHVVWYDRRQNGVDLDVYYAASLDGGASYEPNVRITADSFGPTLAWEAGSAPSLGDYNAVAAAEGRAYPFFQDARRGGQDVYVAVLQTPGTLFFDGFESGAAGRWSESVGTSLADSDPGVDWSDGILD